MGVLVDDQLTLGNQWKQGLLLLHHLTPPQSKLAELHSEEFAVYGSRGCRSYSASGIWWPVVQGIQEIQFKKLNS